MPGCGWGGPLLAHETTRSSRARAGEQRQRRRKGGGGWKGLIPSERAEREREAVVSALVDLWDWMGGGMCMGGGDERATLATSSFLPSHCVSPFPWAAKDEGLGLPLSLPPSLPPFPPAPVLQHPRYFPLPHRHEYTQSNLAFALSVEPENAALRAKIAVATAALRSGQPTVPSTVGSELEINPFMRVGEAAVIKAAREKGGAAGEDPVSVMTALREMKNIFKG